MNIEITPAGDSGLLAVVDGTKLPIVGYGAEPSDDGGVLVSLVVAADEVSVRRSPTSDPEPSQEVDTQAKPATEGKPAQVKVWGDPSIPDPRLRIAGWQPEGLGSQVATHGEESIRARMDRLGVQA